jgi:hypothetical protein
MKHASGTGKGNWPEEMLRSPTEEEHLAAVNIRMTASEFST